MEPLPPEEQTDPGVRRVWRETTEARLAQGAKTMASLRLWTKVILPALALLGSGVSFLVARCDRRHEPPPTPAVELRGTLSLQLVQPKPDGGP